MKLNNLTRVLTICFIIFKSVDCIAQTDSVCHDNTIISDSIPFVADNEQGKSVIAICSSPYKFKPLQLIVPGTLIGVGIIGLESDWLKFQNREIRDELQENIDHRLTIDDFTQYAPMAATYGLNLCGIKGKHGYGDLTIILGTAYALMGTTVYAMKNITKVERPDGRPETRSLQDIQPQLSWGQNYYVGNTGMYLRGLASQDTPSLRVQAFSVCIITAIG